MNDFLFQIIYHGKSEDSDFFVWEMLIGQIFLFSVAGC